MSNLLLFETVAAPPCQSHNNAVTQRENKQMHTTRIHTRKCVSLSTGKYTQLDECSKRVDRTSENKLVVFEAESSSSKLCIIAGLEFNFAKLELWLMSLSEENLRSDVKPHTCVFNVRYFGSVGLSSTFLMILANNASASVS